MQKPAATPAEELTAPLNQRLSERPWAGLPAGEEPDELIGRSLNETYRIEAALGEGGMGRIYRARHSRIQQKLFAIKVLRPELASNASTQARFQREAETAACISHPNVMGVYDVGRTLDGWSYLVCEYLEGLDLAAYLEQVQTLHVEAAVHVALQVCDALDAAHERNVVHRDLKPHNVFLLKDASGEVPSRPNIKVLDFGLSRFLDTTDAQLTRTGVIMGTPAYMAPEQARAERGDHRVDIYGVGTVLYAALTGRAPFKEDTLHATVLAVMTGEPERPRSLRPEIPEGLELVIQKAMARDPKERHASMSELKAALEPFAAAHPARPQSPSAAKGGAQRSSILLDDFELSTSRPRLIFFMLAAVGLSALLLAPAVSGIELFTGPITFSPTELGLLLLAGFGTLLTPMVLLVARLRRTVWGNSVRVLELLDGVRRPLFAGLVAYALAAVGLRFCDEVMSRFGIGEVFAPAPGLSWAGWNLVLPAVVAVALLASVVRARWDRPDAARWRRHLLGAPFLALAAAACGALVLAGAGWRARLTPEPSLQAANASDVSAPIENEHGDEVGGEAAQPAAADSAGPPETSKSLATDEELAAAVSQGVEGLLPLSEKYPDDPRVLKPLVLAFASRATGLADAMHTMKRLFAVAPEELGDADLRFLVKRGAQTPGDASTLAFELMGQHMGAAGPDLLYELLSVNKVRAEAEKLLASPEVRQHSSPALRVAYDLRKASNCAARLPLLERASQLGDERSIAILGPLSTGTKSGCGRWRRSPCLPACAKEATEYQKAVTEISKRVSRSSKG